MELSDFLITGQFVEKNDLQKAIAARQTSSDMTFAEVILVNNYIDPKKMDSFLDNLVPFLSKNPQLIPECKGFIDYSLADTLGKDYLVENSLFPLRKFPLGKGMAVKVMVKDPSNVRILDELSAIYGVTVTRWTPNFDKGLLEKLIVEYEQFSEANSQKLQVSSESKEDDEDALKQAQDRRIVELAEKIFKVGLTKRASDIHFEIDSEHGRIRYRVDGELEMFPSLVEVLDKKQYSALISRLKIISSLDISEHRLPQDGKFKMDINKKRYIDVRVSTLPTQYGESAVLRLLDLSSLDKLQLSKVGMPVMMYQQYREQVLSPQGLILITGPTGSGKTTTLYASLKEVMGERPKQKICTVEDPIEYSLSGITQTQVNKKIDLTFPKVLRSLLRHDPNIILVGEIRDEETAKLAFQASQTGHLVLSTLHTNTAVDSISRLVYMGVENYVISSALSMIVGQRLVRKICENCRELDSDKIHNELVPGTIYKGRGCLTCNNTGYFGRFALYEFFPAKDIPVDDLGNRERLTEIMKERGGVSLREYGWQKVQEGLTTVDEVLAKTV